MQDVTGQRQLQRASGLAGNRVRGTSGEDLGTLREIMIHVPSGRVVYGILSVGGVLGIGDKLFAIPWSSFKFDEYNHEMILPVDRQSLEAAPGFDKDNWPDLADLSMGKEIYGYYGQRPFWDEESGFGSYSAETELTPRGYSRDTTVKDTTGLGIDPSRDRSKL